MTMHAKDIWGVQWIKVLALIYQGVTEGLPKGSNDEKLPFGGQSPEGKSARIRVFLQVERIITASVKPPTLFS
jgi:nucleoporin GLE1